MKFRKKPVVIEAYQLPSAGEDVPHSFYEWVDEVGFSQWESDRDEGLLIKTLEGVMRADPGDWIIKGVAGEFYPCKPDIFAATYEPVSDDAPAAPQAEPQRELSEKQIADACLRYRHDFGLLDKYERDCIVNEARRWADAFGIGGSDADYWLRHRQAILDAIRRDGFVLMSNACGFWLKRMDKASEAHGIGGSDAE